MTGGGGAAAARWECCTPATIERTLSVVVWQILQCKCMMRKRAGRRCSGGAGEGIPLWAAGGWLALRGDWPDSSKPEFGLGGGQGRAGQAGQGKARRDGANTPRNARTPALDAKKVWWWTCLWDCFPRLSGWCWGEEVGGSRVCCREGAGRCSFATVAGAACSWLE